MGVIDGIAGAVFGNGRNVISETAEVFRVNAESNDKRSFAAQAAALKQFGGEFRPVQRGWFDRFMDGLNRVPRPALAFGTLGLFVTAMIDPVWFAARMAGIALVPEPLWWLLGAIVSFYFGARHQAKGQGFQREIAATLAAVPQVVQTVRDVEDLRGGSPDAPEFESAPVGPNPALAAWQASARPAAS